MSGIKTLCPGRQREQQELWKLQLCAFCLATGVKKIEMKNSPVGIELTDLSVYKQTLHLCTTTIRQNILLKETILVYVLKKFKNCNIQ